MKHHFLGVFTDGSVNEDALENMKAEVENICEKHNIECYDQFSFAALLEDGLFFEDNYEKFMEIAIKNNVKRIYILNSTLDTDMLGENDEEHIGDTFRLTVGFFLDSHFHFCVKYADWYVFADDEDNEGDDAQKKLM